MAVLVLFFRGELRKRFLQRRKVENGIVPKTSRTARSFQNLTVHAVGDNRHGSSTLHEGDGANKIGAAFLSSFSSELSQEFRDAFRARCRGSRVSCRLHSRRAAESRYNEARVIGKQQAVREWRVMQRFAQRILRKGRRVFVERGQGIKCWQQLQCDCGGRRARVYKRAKFTKFSRIG